MEAKKQYKIAVAGTGYVGMSMAVLLSQHHEVIVYEIVGSDARTKIYY